MQASAGKLLFQPVADVLEYFLVVRFHQQFVAGTGVELALDVLHADAFQALDGAAHALATGSASPARNKSGRSLGICARKAGSCKRRMPLNML